MSKQTPEPKEVERLKRILLSLHAKLKKVRETALLEQFEQIDAKPYHDKVKQARKANLLADYINSHGILTIDETEVFLYLYKFYNFELFLN